VPRSGARFLIPTVEGPDGPSNETWARKNISYYPESVVEIPGEFASRTCTVLAQIIESSGEARPEQECPTLWVSETALILLVPCGEPGAARTLRLRLRDGSDELDRVDIPLLNRGRTFDPTEARTQIRALLQFPGESLLARCFSERRAQGMSVATAIEAAKRDAVKMADLLRRQFAEERALSAVDRPQRKRALSEVDKILDSTLKHLGGLESAQR
jgi:hypothetical protein